MFELSVTLQIILMVRGATGHSELHHLLHTHTETDVYMLADAFSFFGFSKWLFIDSIDWMWPPHLSSSGKACAVKQYGSLAPDRKSLGGAIDPNQPYPTCQLSVKVELTVLHYYAKHRAPKTIKLMLCACAKNHDKWGLSFHFLILTQSDTAAVKSTVRVTNCSAFC